MDNKFTKGLILGGLITAAFVAGFGVSKEGRNLAKKLKKDLEPMAKRLKENLSKLHDVTKEDFDELVTKIVEEYAKRKEINSESKKTLVNALKSVWNDVKEE